VSVASCADVAARARDSSCATRRPRTSPTSASSCRAASAARSAACCARALSEISLITKDAFEPNLPLSVVVHIDYKKAPLVIQQFGDVKRLVEQTLDPMVSAYC
jgi:uncharacterized membrane protein YqiK